MYEENHEGITPGTSPNQYRPHTVEILFSTAALLVLFVSVYLTFFDSWSAF